MKTPKTNPELLTVGTKCQVSMPSKWIGAYEAAKNIRNGIEDKSNIWNVNTDKEYHEEKK